MDNGSVFIYISGVFGWNGMPIAFQVVSRILRTCIMVAIIGWVCVYVDDIIGCGCKSSWVTDTEVATNVICNLLGSTSEAVDKRECTETNEGRSVVCLGWEIMLNDWTVDVAKDNRYKALYFFWTVDLEKPISMVEMERLCSLAQRYSEVYRELGVLMGNLYRMLGGKGSVNRNTCRYLTEEAKVAIRLWRTYLVMSEISRDKGYSRGRSMESFRLRTADWLVEFDGSLSGVGYRIFVLKDGSEVLLEAGLAMAEFDLGGISGYQNSMEMAAAVIGMLALVELGYSGGGVKLRGDSQTVLSWATKGETFKSDRSLGANMVFVTICEMFDLKVTTDSEHITSEQNHVCDGFSRGKLPDISTRESEVFQIGVPWGKMHGILRLCNPLDTPKTEKHFQERWGNIQQLLEDNGREW
jgi:hypothetical protein